MNMMNLLIIKKKNMKINIVDHLVILMKMIFLILIIYSLVIKRKKIEKKRKNLKIQMIKKLMEMMK